MGYHKARIEPGEYGKLSKIREEFEELCDAVLQDNKVMALQELADMLGAMEGWLEANFKDVTLKDIFIMKKATRSAFEDGTRKPR